MTIKVKFHIGKKDFTLHTNLNIPSEGITALFGTSGCGKTTILRAIAGLDYYNNSFLKIKNTVWQDDKIFIPSHKRQFGYVFQETNLFTNLSVRKNLEYGIKRSTKNNNRFFLQQIIKKMKIGHILDKKPNLLSGGEKKRVAIAQAIVIRPKILLMDEPLNGIDSKAKIEILSYLNSICNETKTPIIYVSHILEEITHIANHIVLFDKNKITKTYNIYEILTKLDTPIAHYDNAKTIIKT